MTTENNKTGKSGTPVSKIIRTFKSAWDPCVHFLNERCINAVK